jgi:hypothetical protein
MKHARHTGSALLATVTLAFALGASVPASAANHGGSLPPRPPGTAPAVRRGRVAVVTRSVPAPQHRTLPAPGVQGGGASGSGAIEARRDDNRLRRRAPESRATLAAACADAWTAGSVPATLRDGHPPASAAPFYEANAPPARPAAAAGRLS